MKRLWITGIICLLVLPAPVLAEAAESQPTCSIGNCNVGECFMDTDGDGMCGDHCFIDENEDGICDNHCYSDEDCDGVCDYFTDGDLDGICDHCHEHGKPAKTVRSRRAVSGRHHSGHHSRHHRSHCR